MYFLRNALCHHRLRFFTCKLDALNNNRSGKSIKYHSFIIGPYSRNAELCISPLFWFVSIGKTVEQFFPEL